MVLCSELLLEHQLRLHHRRATLLVDRSADGLRKNILIEFLHPNFSHDLGLLQPKMKRLNLTLHSLAKPRMPAFSVSGAEFVLLELSGRRRTKKGFARSCRDAGTLRHKHDACQRRRKNAVRIGGELLHSSGESVSSPPPPDHKPFSSLLPVSAYTTGICAPQ